MGKRSVRENKNMYQQAREKAGLTRERAAEQMVFVSDDRIEKIESERSQAHPDEILAMAECYKEPVLPNYFCSHECPIGQKNIPEIIEKELPLIVMELLNHLNKLSEKKDRLIEIASDGVVHPDECEDFLEIRDRLLKLSLSADTLRVWVEKATAENRLGVD